MGETGQEAYVCEADNALVDEADAAVDYDASEEGSPGDVAPRDAGKAPQETGHGGGGDDQGRRVRDFLFSPSLLRRRKGRLCFGPAVSYNPYHGL